LKNVPSAENKKAAYRISNIGNGNPQSLGDFITAIETSFGVEAKKEYLPMQAGDVPQTWADISELEKFGYTSTTEIESGVRKFVDWYNNYNKREI
jgi:UDP-glucuronate 4-epimerase